MRLLMPILLLLLPAPAFAAAEPSGDLFTAALKLLAGLVVVLGLMLLLYALSRKGLKFFPGARGGAVEVLETRYLGPKKSICLVRVRGRELLLGLGSERVELLCALEGTEHEGFESALEKSLEARP